MGSRGRRGKGGDQLDADAGLVTNDVGMINEKGTSPKYARLISGKGTGGGSRRDRGGERVEGEETPNPSEGGRQGPASRWEPTDSYLPI